MKIGLSTDHAGFDQLKQLMAFLVSLGHECVNFGPQELNPDDDYPNFIEPAAKAVASGEVEMGIILGGSGQGEAMAANRVKGVRCAVYYGPAKATGAVDVSGAAGTDQYDIIRLSRQHNNANMLSLASRFVEQAEMEKVISLWLATDFSGDVRHSRRLAELDEA